MCHFNHFEVYNSGTLITITMLGNYHHYLFPKRFITPKQKL